MRTWVQLTGIAALAAASLYAQGGEPGGTYAVRGEISSTTPVVGSLTAELVTMGGGPTERVMINGDGSFEFRYARPGAHELRLVTMSGTIIHQETVFITGANQFLSIRLPDSPGASRSVDSTISLRQLTHKIPPQAQKAYNKGEQASAKGKHREAADLFRQAVTIDPEFVDAFNELGAAEAALGNLPQAAEDFQKAVDLVPEHRLALPNLSIVLAKLRRFREAAEVARRALKVVPASGTVRYILAASLLFEKGDTDEALDNLERATSEVPKAHLVAADILALRGKRLEAIRHLEEYLRVAPAGDKDRARAEAKLAELRQ